MSLSKIPFFTLAGHVVYRFRPGLWTGASLGYGYGGESTVNGVGSGDRKENFAWGLSFGYPISRQWRFKAAYLATRAQEAVGFDSDTIVVGVSTFW
jgi:hypothetical protein